MDASMRRRWVEGERGTVAVARGADGWAMPWWVLSAGSEVRW